MQLEFFLSHPSYKIKYGLFFVRRWMMFNSLSDISTDPYWVLNKLVKCIYKQYWQFIEEWNWDKGKSKRLKITNVFCHRTPLLIFLLWLRLWVYIHLTLYFQFLPSFFFPSPLPACFPGVLGWTINQRNNYSRSFCAWRQYQTVEVKQTMHYLISQQTCFNLW